MTTLYEEKARGFGLKVSFDEYPESPRDPEFNELTTTMLCFHRGYRLGDKHDMRYSDYLGWDGLREHLRKTYKPVLIEPLYLYDHSGLRISTTPFECPWDSGQVGFVYATKAHIRAVHGSVPQRVEAQKHLARSLIDADVKTYDQYLSGEVYRAEVIRLADNEVVDSFGGCYGTLDDAIAEGRELLSYSVMFFERKAKGGQLEFNYDSLQAAPAAQA